MAPILTEIESEIETLIEGMTIAGGYNFDWGTVNEDDEALMQFPSAQVLFISETNIDPVNGAHAGAYENVAEFNIVITGRMDNVNDNPNYSVNVEHNKLLDDVKRLFGIYEHIDGTANSIMYRGSERQIDRNGDIFRPGRIITRWEVRYCQDRVSPETVAN